MGEICTPTDIISQYNIHFTNLRKATPISSCPPPLAAKGPGEIQNNGDMAL